MEFSPDAFLSIASSFSKSFFLLAAVCGLGDILGQLTPRALLKRPARRDSGPL
jgi:hypothetical protein